ncbi:MAG: ATP-binding protein [Chloroflexota bacterium]
MPYPIYKVIEELNSEDIDGLIGEDEGNTLEFKLDCYTPDPSKDKNDWKREFCKDVSALANANGGWIFCGIKEEDSKAVEITGLGLDFNVDENVRRLDQCANSSIDPRIMGLKIRAIELTDTNKKDVVAIYVPRSFAAPHRSNLTYKFHLRRSARVEEMDMTQIRTAFNLSNSLEERIRQFRKQRVEAISTKGHEDVPVLLSQDSYYISMHIVPLTFDDPSKRINTFNFHNRIWFEIFRDRARDARYNFDGYMMPVERESYFQFFRTGAIEWVKKGPIIKNSDVADKRFISLPAIATACLSSLDSSMKSLANLQIDSPVSMMVSLINIKGLCMIDVEPSNASDLIYSSTREGSQPLVRSNLLIPDIVLENFGDPRDILRPVFDILWNTEGYDHCSLYDENGNWITKEARS